MLEALTQELTNTFSAVPPVESTVRLLAAIILAGIIGFERERRHKPAGLRTHMLVSMAASLFIIVGREITLLEFGDQDAIQVDPLRLIEAVTAGVAFLAAGIIFTSRGRVHNITTGASLWLSGAIGLACGAGQIPLAALATIIVVIVLLVLRKVEAAMGWLSETDTQTGRDDP